MSDRPAWQVNDEKWMEVLVRLREHAFAVASSMEVTGGEQVQAAGAYFTRATYLAITTVKAHEQGGYIAARVLLRAQVECVLYLGAVCKDEAFVAVLKNDAASRLAEALKNYKQHVEPHRTNEQLEDLDKIAAQANVNGAKTVNMYTISKKADMLDLFQGPYNHLSLANGHSNYIAVSNHMQRAADGSYEIKLDLPPDQAAGTLAWCAQALLASLKAMTLLFPSSSELTVGLPALDAAFWQAVGETDAAVLSTPAKPADPV